MGSKTLNDIFYKPDIGASGAVEKGKFDDGLDVADGFIEGNKPANNKLSAFAATTSADLASVISDEVGTGKLLFSSVIGNLVVSNWTTRVPAEENEWGSVCWSPELELFCAVASSGTDDRVMTSPDGINWTSRTSADDNGWDSVCWSPELELFCAVSYSGTGNRVMTSPDGINWTSRTSAADNGWYSVCWSPELGLFVAVAWSGVGTKVMTSLFYK